MPPSAQVSCRRRLAAGGAALATALIGGGPALAHGRAPVAPDALWASMAPQWGVLVPLLAIHFLYGRGVFATWHRTGTRSGLGVRHVLAFAGGEVVLLVALVSPLEGVAGTLFSAHMIQHVLLVAVAPPLLLAGRPDVALLWGLGGLGGRLAKAPPVRAVFRFWNAGARPMPAAAIHGAVVGAWHIPAAFDAALDSPILHDLEHLSFFGSALLFWRALQIAGRQARTAALGALAALTTMIYGGLLGALISFAPRPLYERYVWTGLWGLDPLEDQQLAGLVMWVPVGMIYLAAGLLLLARVLQPPAGTAARAARR
jgi:putative membrane protein